MSKVWTRWLLSILIGGGLFLVGKEDFRGLIDVFNWANWHFVFLTIPMFFGMCLIEGLIIWRMGSGQGLKKNRAPYGELFRIMMEVKFIDSTGVSERAGWKWQIASFERLGLKPARTLILEVNRRVDLFLAKTGVLTLFLACASIGIAVLNLRVAFDWAVLILAAICIILWLMVFSAVFMKIDELVIRAKLAKIRRIGDLDEKKLAEKYLLMPHGEEFWLKVAWGGLDTLRLLAFLVAFGHQEFLMQLVIADFVGLLVGMIQPSVSRFPLRDLALIAVFFVLTRGQVQGLGLAVVITRRIMELVEVVMIGGSCHCYSLSRTLKN